jgi:nitrate reductase delta subunit
MIGRRSTAVPYKLLSVLLRYPDAALVDARGEIASSIAALPESKAKGSLEAFDHYLAGAGTVESAQRYVETFDLCRRTSLYLTYYLHGDTRRRGMALLRLRRLYAAAGLEAATGELPDYLPLMLEFASLAPDGFGEALLVEYRPSLELLRAGLHETASPYAHLLDALAASLPRLTPRERQRVRKLAAEGPPSEQVGLEPFAPPEVMPEARI